MEIKNICHCWNAQESIDQTVVRIREGPCYTPNIVNGLNPGVSVVHVV